MRGARGGARGIGPLLVAVALLACPAPAVPAAPWPLSPEPARWAEELFLEGAAARLDPRQAAVFGRGADPQLGAFVSVGPWRAGSHAARLAYRTPYPSPTGTVRGRYRTEGLLPQQACVTVSFLRGGEVLAKRRHHLAPSASWRAFEVPVRTPPAGADSFRAAFGLSDRTEGRVDFARLSVSPEVAAPAFPAEAPPPARPAPPAAFAGGDAYRVERAGDVFWLATPAGRPFYSVGVDGPAWEEALPLRSGEAWAAEVRALGFNSLAGWTSVASWSAVNAALADGGGEPLPIFVALESNAVAGRFDRLVDARGDAGAPGHAFPDPYDPAFETAYRAEVLRRRRELGGGPWLAAWFADNELDHAGLARRVHSRHCAAAFRAFLAGRHGTIGALNRAWGTRYASFDDLAAAPPDPLGRRDAMAEDFRRFARETVARYVDVTIRAIRAADPGRLIFSNRFMASGLGETADYLDLYARYDAVAVNLYPQNLAPGLDGNETALLRLVHERTGRPVLVAEWSVPALDSGLYDGPPEALDWSWNEAVGTQAERAEQAARVAADLFGLPFVIGAHWFTWRDVDAGGRRANRGLFGADGRPWEELQRRLGAAQRRLGR